MTKEEYKRVVEIYGEDFNWWDIPAYIRKRDEAEVNDALENEGKQILWEEREKEKYEERD